MHGAPIGQSTIGPVQLVFQDQNMQAKESEDSDENEGCSAILGSFLGKEKLKPSFLSRGREQLFQSRDLEPPNCRDSSNDREPRDKTKDKGAAEGKPRVGKSVGGQEKCTAAPCRHDTDKS